MQTYDCEPTLNDSEVLEFCKNGYMLLDRVVPSEINKKVTAWVNEPAGKAHVENYINLDDRYQDLAREQWFKDNVLLNDALAGALRSLLGKNFGLPSLIANHKSECPIPEAQDWHWDGGAKFGPQINYVLVFYLPEGCPRDMGPTEILPSSHFLFSPSSYMGHYGSIKGSYFAVCEPGSILIMNYSLWHRRSGSWGTGTRNNLKLCYWRNSQPTRDWVKEPDFDMRTADYNFKGPLYSRRNSRPQRDAAELFFWMSGLADKYEWIGGQGWPAFNMKPPLAEFPDGLPEYLKG